MKAVVNAAKKAGAQVRQSQVRITAERAQKKVRVMSLVDHDAWAARSEAEWAEELERVKKHRV
jgi:sialic acid synthase SpsE